jgi:hypothetical protein
MSFIKYLPRGAQVTTRNPNLAVDTTAADCRRGVEGG